MKTQLTPRDWQLLSDFLDHQLTPRERAALEKRISQHADLQTGLQELQQTRAVLRAAPRRRAPRNFTLKPDQVPARRALWRGWTPVFSFASAASALLAAVMFIGQMFSFGASAPMMASAPQALPMEAPAAEAMDAAAATPQIITWGEPVAPGIGGAGGGGDGTTTAYGLGSGPETAPEVAAEKAMEPPANPAPTEAPVEAQPILQPTPSADRLMPTPTAVLPAATILQTTPTPGLAGAPPAESENLILGLAPEEEQGQARTQSSADTVAQTPLRSAPNRMPWWSIAFFVSAVLFAVLAIHLRRR